MIDWKPIKTAPRNTIILLGTESDKAVDTHMFFVDIGWAYKDGFWSVTDEDIIFPSHWAPINSPIASAAVAFYKDSKYRLNRVA